MKFLVDSSIQSEGRKLNFIDVGIHDNVELTEVKVDKSPKGNNFIAFTFTAPDGKQLTKTEYEPSESDDSILMKKAQNQAKRIKHTMTKFMTEEQATIEYDTENWVKYASTVKVKLDATKTGIKLKIKAIYDNNNYVTLPNYVPFLERMGTEPSTLEISSIDKMTKDEPDTEVFVQNPLEETNTTMAAPTNDSLVSLVESVESENKGDLPF